MYKQNDTQAFINAIFLLDDHLYIFREAQWIDASGRKAARQKELVDFRVIVAQLREDRELAKQQKAIQERQRILETPLVKSVSDIYAKGMTISKIHDQFEILRLCGVQGILVNSCYLNKPKKQAALEAAFRCYLEDPGSYPLPMMPIAPTASEPVVVDDWEAEDDADMEEY
ncbi:hypothetical protein B0H10DRAFT_2219297 [Mycena sp. CBHHK59/15]|nr:hypothetical protein B0H10DRAFT_2219297 [Mycena sp. CBHHK59/15]